MKINLLPGIPDDDNRDYLPEYLKDSEIVVNENGNNSQVYPKRLEEKKGALVDEFVDTWYQYVPESYNPEKKDTGCFFHARRVNDWMGTGSIYIVDTYCRQRRIHLYFPKCTASQILDNRMRG